MFFRKKNNFDENDHDSVLDACIQQNPNAQKLLIRMYVSFVKNISQKYASNDAEVDEMVNDSFLKIFNNLEKYNRVQPFKAWLRTIAVNTAIDYYRKNQKFKHELDVTELEIADFNPDIISKISADEILKLVQQLPNSYRMVFTLYVVDGYQHREIADMLGIKEGTSKSNLRDARLKLQQLVLKNYPNLYMAYSLKMNKINEN